jgi:hypothetical protein
MTCLTYVGNITTIISTLRTVVLIGVESIMGNTIVESMGCAAPFQLVTSTQLSSYGAESTG